MKETLKKNLPFITVAVVAVLMLLPFLGLSDFNTKGEPREAVVALSMIKDGNWILPVNNGVDIPYKPPFFHFCIALVSLLTGSVSEYTSRLPSALSLIALTLGCFGFYRKRLVSRRSATTVALMGSLLLLTSFEVHRAGITCRVDMMLTAFTMGAMLLLYRWWERGSRGVPVMAVLCMSGAVLTKGPVGFVVPCFVVGVFMLLRGEKFWRTFWRLTLFALLSCIIPAVWYVAAWRQGGDQFLNLVYEENIGRMTGSMSYESHEHAFPYNFFTLFVGWAPWTVMLLLTLFSRPWKALQKTGRVKTPADAADKQSVGAKLLAWLTQQRIRLMQVPPIRLFTWTAFLLVLFFYCLPSSKRSVYLLPCYPFMAMLIAEYVDWLWQTHRTGGLRAYVGFMAAIAVILVAAFEAIRMGLVPDTIFHGKHAAENIAMLDALRTAAGGFFVAVLKWLPIGVAVDSVQAVFARKTRNVKSKFVYCLFAPVVLLTVALDGLYQPLVLNTKSLRPMAAYISTTFRGEPVYAFINDPYMHFFGADFYLGDTIKPFEQREHTVSDKQAAHVTTPDSGVLVVPTADFEVLARRHGDYTFTLVKTFTQRISEIKGDVSFYRFQRKAANTKH